jgi:hypothetical protein
MPYSEDDLLRLLHSTEHTFVERKTSSYSLHAFVKTIVAFANSLEGSQEGVLFIGATDKGEIEGQAQNFDSIQKKLTEKMGEAYPPVFCQYRCIRESNRECLAVIVPGSSAKPHFTGSPYLRDGSKTIKAPPSQYDALIAWRLDKVRELQKWIAQNIILRIVSRRSGIHFQQYESLFDATVSDCNQFYVTLKTHNGTTTAYPLSEVRISFNYGGKRLQLEYTDPISR